MGLSLTVKLESRLEQRLEKKLILTLQQQMGIAIEALRSETGGDPEVALENVLDLAIQGLGNSQIQEAVRLIFQNPVARASIIKNAHSLIKPQPEFNKIAADVIFQSHSMEGIGSFQLEDSDGVRETVKVIRARFDDAIFAPKKALKEMAELEDIIRTQDDTRGAIMARDELADAIKIAEISKESVIQFGQLLELLYQQEEDGNSILRSFLQDAILLRRLDFVITDRLANRFANSFLIVNRNANVVTRSKKAMLNYVGEYVLICMGIIDPSIFQLHRGDIKHNHLLKDDLAETGIDLDALLARYRLQGEGTLFWNRYFVKGQRPTAITDNLIRDFITKTVRKSGDEILDCIKFDDKFEDIVASMEESREEKLTKEEKKDFLRQQCVEIFIDPEFTKFLTKKIKEEWTQKLDTFY